jgi:tetratricopeptide (TPR) repeat protein
LRRPLSATRARLETCRDAAEIQFALAQILLRTGRAEEAIDAIEAGLALSPESTKGRFLKKLESIAK